MTGALHRRSLTWRRSSADRDDDWTASLPDGELVGRIYRWTGVRDEQWHWGLFAVTSLQRDDTPPGGMAATGREAADAVEDAVRRLQHLSP